MNMEGLKSWATLGISTPPVKKNKTPSKNTKIFEKYLTSDFSRYGVGSKKAIFNIGNEVTLISKEKNSRWVYEVSLSKSKLEEDFKNDIKWKTNVISRLPKENEKSFESFTQVTISDIKTLYVDNYDSKILRRELARIYHYYIFGSKGNIEKNDEKNDEKTFDDEDDHFIDIVVDGKSIKETIDDDLETRYLRLGKNPFEFEFKVSSVVNEYDPISSSQIESKKKIFSTVKGIIYYYPYKNGGETLPAINDDQEMPLNDRNPGFECFWNGRLLSYEKIPFLTFTKLKKSQEIPDVCYRRIKGMIFLDSSFEVSANKMFLCRQTPLCQSLLNYDDRNLTINFRKWIKECHSKYDEEIIFLERDTKTDLNSDKTYFLKIKYGSKEIKKNDKVLLKKPKIVGDILDIFRDSTCENYGCLFTIKEWNSNQEEKELITIPISRIDKIMSPSDFKSYTSKLKSKVPTYVDIVDTPNVVLNLQKPPSEPVEAGYILKWITVSVFTGEHKIINKNCGMYLKIFFNGKEVTSTFADKPYKDGKYCYKIQSLISLNDSGEYQFKFKSEFPDVKEKVYTLNVLPGPVDALECETKELIGEIGEKLKDIYITQTDQFGNIIKFEKNDHLKIKSLSEQFNIKDTYSFQLENDQIVIKGIEIIGKIFNLQEELKIEISKGNIMKPLILNVKLKHGKPKIMKFTEETLKLIEIPTPVKKVLPKTNIILYDSFQNQVYGNYTCISKSSYIFGTIESSLINGEFSFDEKTCLKLKEDIIESGEIIVEFTLKEDEEIILKHPFKVEASSVTPTKIRLIPSEEQSSFLKSSHSKESEIQAVVGTEITGWKICLLDESGSQLEMNGIASFSWSTKKEVIQKGECILPNISIIQVLNTITYTIFLGKEDSEVQYKLIITSIKGNPIIIKNTHKNMKKVTCGEPFTLNFAIFDSFSNIFDVLNEKHLYPDLDRINPIIEIIEKDKKIRFIEKGKIEITNRGTFKFKDIKIVGPSTDFTLIIKDENEIVKEEKIELQLEIGRPSLVKVNDSTEIEYQISNYGKLPTLYISVHDLFGNIINQIFSFEIVPPNEINLYTGQQKEKIDLQQTNGVFEIQDMFIKAEKGKHLINIFTKERDLPPAKLIIDVQLSNHPQRFTIKYGNEQIEDKKNISKEAGETLGIIQLLVIGEDQNPTESPVQIQMTIIDINNDKKSFISNFKENYYIFEESKDYLFEKIGKYTMSFNLPLSSLEFEKIVDPTNSIKQKYIIDVKAGSPSYIDVDSDFILPAISNTPDDINKRSFWEDLSVYVMDSCGNKIEDYQGEVSIKISPSEKAPKLEGNLTTKFSKGRAKFGRLSVKEKSKGIIGTYKLIFECNNLSPKELEFKFFDDAELQEEQNRIQKEISKFQKELEKKKTELYNHEKEFNDVKDEYELIEKELKDSQIISNFVKNFEMNDIDKSIKSIQNKMNEKKKDKGRKSVYTKDESLEKVLELKKEDSGIIGIVADLGFVENENLDKVLSTLIGKFMTSVVVKDKNTSDKLRKSFEKSKSQISIIPLDNINKNKNLDENNRIIFTNIGEIEGFIGYATNLIDISSQNPELRYVFLNLYSDTLVFDNYQNGYNYRQKLLENNQKCQTIITLDNDKIESIGIVYAGKKIESSNRFGQLHPTESFEFKDLNDKMNKLEKYKEILNKKNQLKPKFDKSEKKFKEMKEKLQNPIKELTDKIEKLQSQTIIKGKIDNPSKISSKTTSKRKVEEEETKSKKKKLSFVEEEAEEVNSEEEEESFLEDSQDEESPKKKK